MSVQTQIDRITTEVSAQEALLDQALALIESKAAGGGSGGSVETCNLTIDFYKTGTSTSAGITSAYSATVLNDSKEIDSECSLNISFPLSISNVVVGSSIMLAGAFTPLSIESEKCELLEMNSKSNIFAVKVAGSGEGNLIVYIS